MLCKQGSNLNTTISGQDLTQLARQFGTDKAPNCTIYERYLGVLREENINLLEIGVGGSDDPNIGGASLRMWKAYFSKANIYGLDLYDKSTLEQERIRIFRGSQDDPATLQKVASDIGFINVIIDDGSHICAHIIRSFEVLFPLLVPGGIYVVEDIGTSYWPDYGGSEDFLNPNTSVAYFKRLVDGIQHPHFRHAFTPTYADAHTRFVHFYENMIFIQKS
jgi:hypothetical protein